MSRKLVSSVAQFPRPKTKRQIKQFLGIANFLRRNLPNFGILAKTFNRLLRKSENFRWTEQAETAFQAIKKLVTIAPDFQPFSVHKTSHLWVDASQFGFAGCILQRGPDNLLHPVSYCSRTLTVAEIRYDIFSLEMSAAYYVIKAFHSFLYGTFFYLYSDNKATCHIKTTKNLNCKLARLSIFFENYDFDITHVPSGQNPLADALSRNTLPVLPDQAQASVPDSSVSIYWLSSPE